jgi:hypothetical protein
MNNNELCYKLNIPFLQDMVKDDWKQNLNWKNRFQIPKFLKVEELLKEEYLNYNNINWGVFVTFLLDKKVKAQIHSDNRSLNDDIPDDLENPTMTLFAINFVVTGSCRMDYYLPSQLDKDCFFEPDSEYPQRNWATTQEPYKSYEMEPGAYLLNITVPHKAVAHSDRLLLSLRPSLNPHENFVYWKSKSWDDIVKLFENHII